MKESGLVICLVMASFYILMCEGSEPCNRKCGSKTVPYPFGFGGECPNMLDCSGESNITVKGFHVENITSEGVRISHGFQCRKQLKGLRAFQEQYALTTRNVLLVKDCPKLGSSYDCSFNLSLVVNRLSNEENQSCNSSEYSCLRKNGTGFYKWKDLDDDKCNTLLGHIVVDRKDDSEILVDLGSLELGWWINGNCTANSCSANADCKQLLSPGTGEPAYKCSCKAGFVGDGFESGDGCYKESSKCNPSRYMSGSCGGTNRIGVLIGGIVAGVAVVLLLGLLYCMLKRRSKFVRSRRSRKRLQEASRGSTIHIFTYRELERATKGFSEKQRLGNGAFGTVYEGRLGSERAVAVKKIRHMERQGEGIQQVMNEIKLLSSVDHPNLVRLIGCCIENGEAILVYEYMPNGTLAEHLQRHRGEGLSWTRRLTLASETASALAYLHSTINPPIYHRDVKSSNILLDFNFNSKVGDFGLSRIVPTEESHISTVPQGTPGYVDPQYHQNFHLSDKSDVYSFGVVLVEIITALKVVDFTRNKSEISLAVLALDKIGSGCLHHIIDPFLLLDAENDPSFLSSVHMVAELAFRCLAFDRDARPCMLEVAEELQSIGASYALSHAQDKDDMNSSNRQITIQQSVISQLKSSVTRLNPDMASPVSVQDPWVSGQSSPSTSSSLDNTMD
ncbi:wall-associated receptor kinase-like 14 [Cryptomeria japonica]|uniref:wall-associated receptor kinase-like 14 n=1 Tax=Cryptomeria japonica TaxID=3369 RepID=UPI0027DA1BE3|nr:wall-associated receptor kinase-like 14 [Cryptomeria japonica]XP_057873775.2 wall-associated receptor kinase-like 14 [Cryptomeria japonica]XP_057873776.2 wall-associated receptor kinase-like 14 [Cryptomeria japonica]XP_057873777.2 wall-associated receptor kinase-like 14 [Cryptomeria japonica]